MKKIFSSIFCLLFLLNLVLACLTGCSAKPIYDKTITTYVFAKEFDDDHGLSEEVIEEFYHHVYDGTEYQYIAVDVELGYQLPYVRNLIIINPNTREMGFCHEYLAEENAREVFNDPHSLFSLHARANELGMPLFYTRIGKYIFEQGGQIWQPLMEQIGIEFQVCTYEVASTEKPVFEEMQDSMNLEKLLLAFEQMNYGVHLFQSGSNTEWFVVRDDGMLAFSISNHPSIIEETKKHRRDLRKSALFNYECTENNFYYGITVYWSEEYVVFSRGNSFAKFLEECRSSAF